MAKLISFPGALIDALNPPAVLASKDSASNQSVPRIGKHRKDK